MRYWPAEHLFCLWCQKKKAGKEACTTSFDSPEFPVAENEIQCFPDREKGLGRPNRGDPVGSVPYYQLAILHPALSDSPTPILGFQGNCTYHLTVRSCRWVMGMWGAGPGTQSLPCHQKLVPVTT